MVDVDRVDELSSEVTSRAARAGMWMIASAVVLFLAGVIAGLTIDRKLMGKPVAAAPVPVAQVVEDVEVAALPNKPGLSLKIDTPIWLRQDYEYKPGTPEILDQVARRVRQILDLDAAQEKQVRAIIDKHHPRMEALRKQFEPELRKLAITALADLWPVLEGEQRGRLNRILGRHGKWLIGATSRPTTAATASQRGTAGK